MKRAVFFYNTVSEFGYTIYVSYVMTYVHRVIDINHINGVKGGTEVGKLGNPVPPRPEVTICIPTET